jgi:penicillin-binding protein 2
METISKFRIYLLTALVLGGFGVLVNRLHEFQIERRYEFLNRVPGNQSVTVREPGIRGIISDRSGIPLAHNRRQYEVSFNLAEIQQAYITEQRAQKKSPTGKSASKEKEKDIVAIVNETTIAQLRKLDLARNYNASALRTHFLTHGGLVPFRYRSDLSFEEFSKLAEHNIELPGVYLALRPQREYPLGTLASHVLGYLKQWEKGDIEKTDERRFTHYIGSEKGIAGVEATMDALLRGPEGIKTIVRNEKGRTIRMSDYTKPGTGATVRLTIDARKQLLLENALRHAGRAAGVIMDPNTGEILAMASVPDYDPNAFIPSISQDRWKSYNSNRLLSPLTNRAISEYAPGSTMKLATAIAGALQGQAQRSFSCDGYVAYGKHQIGCWIWNQSKGSHGSIGLTTAIQKSCNPYFNKLANSIGWRDMVQGCGKVGLGKPTGVELPGEKPGILPGSDAWLNSHPGATMSAALTAMLSIGQGDSMATPLQIAAMTASIANRGTYLQPRIVKSAISEEGKTLIADKPKAIRNLIQDGIKPDDLQLIRKGMWLAVNSGGTAGKVRISEAEVAAKTGTAQTVENGKKSNNSWITSFAPYEEPRYVVCVLAQNAGSGGGVCGPLVNLIYKGLFGDEKDQRLPLRAQTEFVGNTDRIEHIDLPKNALAEIRKPANGNEPDLEEYETGDEAGIPSNTSPNITIPPTPTLTPEVDPEGTVIPRALPVTEP